MHTTEGQVRYLAVNGGYLEVLNNHVSVLADSAALAEDIDLVRAKPDLEKATAQLGTSPDPDTALAAVNRAQAWVNAAERKS